MFFAQTNYLQVGGNRQDRTQSATVYFVRSDKLLAAIYEYLSLFATKP